MKFDIKQPCNQCPYVEGGIRLEPERIIEIDESLKEFLFPCHKTVDKKNGNQQCAGATIYARNCGYDNRLLKMARTLVGYTVDKLKDTGVFKSLNEWLEKGTFK